MGLKLEGLRPEEAVAKILSSGLTPELLRIELGKLSPQQLETLLPKIPGVFERLNPEAVLTEKQTEADVLLSGPATHCMLFGGSRSGKTFLITRKIVSRALSTTSRHAIMRFRFNHVIASVAMDTLPKVMDLCFKGTKWKLDKSQWLVRFENTGSEIWFGGLDEKERTEKILGQEYATIFLNECSQIPLASRDIAVTRLAQMTSLTRKMFYDCNPPSKRHWTYQLFIDKIDPNRHQPLPNPDNYCAMQINPEHNRANLDAAYLEDLGNLDERKRRRFLLGIFSDDDDTALWTPELLDKNRLVDTTPPPMLRVIVAVDPSGCSGPEDLRSDEIGIVVVGLGVDGRGYVLEDLSGHYGPNDWKEIVVSAYERYEADAVVAETNFGGSMVQEIIRTAKIGTLPLSFREVKASRGKIVRAEPIAALWQQGKVSLVGRFQDLEYQLTAMTMAGYMGDKSPDRADAMIWGLASLFPAMAREKNANDSKLNVVLGYQKSKPEHAKLAKGTRGNIRVVRAREHGRRMH